MYRPHRHWDKESIMKAASGPSPYGEEDPFPKSSPVGFVSPSPLDHPEAEALMAEALDQGRRVSFSSMRLSAVTEEMALLFAEGKIQGLAVAPEGGTDRLRLSMNKGLSEEKIIEGARVLSKAGLRRLKLYFMIGLPGETDGDISAIADLSEKIKKASKGKSSAPFISVSVSNFSPKPHTPFEDAPLLSESELKRKGELLSGFLGKVKGASLRLDPPLFSIVQSLLGRSGPEGGSLLRELLKAGGKAKHALKAWGYEERSKTLKAGMSKRPWRIIAPPQGIAHLEEEKRRALEGLPTAACPASRKCGRCEACKEGEGEA
jgi:radical SAM superfamily enzyme YgiQ (UPF0313 family)